ncbi:MAG: orotidine-5'-phosphate decarboxylase [Deltaproteobacteria bacterium]|nr:orotidine-5'-phosphate decarboxylase [Deltaproteobacteria bacterium]
MKHLDRVIVALDQTDPAKAFRLVDTLGDTIRWYKIGPMLFTRAGNEVISFLHKRSKKIFLDLKLHDIPKVVADTLHQVADLGVQFATVHCLGGRRMLQAASYSCRGSQLKLIGVTVLTSLEMQDWRSLGWTHTNHTATLLLDWALEARFAGIVCSPQELSSLRCKALDGFLLITPGIRPMGCEVFNEDQVRVATPQQALEWGADYVVVGRPVTQAREPRQAVESLFQI